MCMCVCVWWENLAFSPHCTKAVSAVVTVIKKKKNPIHTLHCQVTGCHRDDSGRTPRAHTFANVPHTEGGDDTRSIRQMKVITLKSHDKPDIHYMQFPVYCMLRNRC